MSQIYIYCLFCSLIALNILPFLSYEVLFLMTYNFDEKTLRANAVTLKAFKTYVKEFPQVTECL